MGRISIPAELLPPPPKLPSLMHDNHASFLLLRLLHHPLLLLLCLTRWHVLLSLRCALHRCTLPVPHTHDLQLPLSAQLLSPLCSPLVPWHERPSSSSSASSSLSLPVPVLQPVAPLVLPTREAALNTVGKLHRCTPAGVVLAVVIAKFPSLNVQFHWTNSSKRSVYYDSECFGRSFKEHIAQFGFFFSCSSHPLRGRWK